MCRYAGMYASMHVCGFYSATTSHLVCTGRYEGIQVCMHLCMHVSFIQPNLPTLCARLQEGRYAGMYACVYASMYVSM